MENFWLQDWFRFTLKIFWTLKLIGRRSSKNCQWTELVNLGLWWMIFTKLTHQDFKKSGLPCTEETIFLLLVWIITCLYCLICIVGIFKGGPSLLISRTSNQIIEFISVTISLCSFLGLSSTLLSWNILTDIWFSYKISPKLDY